MGLRVGDIPGIDPRLARRLMEAGYDELWPSQADAAPVAVAGKNLVLAVPTASGKSLVAYLAILQRCLKGAKALYIVPLRALAAEKFEDLRDLGRPLGLRVALSIGDYDAAEPQLGSFDVIVCTSEKADALLRHRAHWLRSIGCIVSDEVHLLNDAGRGPTLEVILTRFRQLNPEAQIVALSATVANSAEVASWLKATHVKNEWRPVKLREGIWSGREVKFLDNAVLEIDSQFDDPSLALAEDACRTGGQVLVFVNTRKSTEAMAEKLRDATRKHLRPENKAALEEMAASLKGAEETSVERKLAKALKDGAAFHHAGLTNTERSMVEQAFKAGHLKAIAATPTLAAGVNLPARRVIVRDLWRYDVEAGNAPLPVLEYKQMAGRAGRPKYDKVGEAITIARAPDEREAILLNYLLADSERVISKLGTENALRTHVLASIASGFVEDETSLKDFIRATFYAEQGDVWTIETRITSVLDFLLEEGFIEAKGDRFSPTKFGKRVSELYVDPLSGVKMRNALKRVDEVELTPMSFLHAVCSTPDMPQLYMRRADQWLEGEVLERERQFLLPPPSGLDYEWFLAELKTASLVHDWCEEVTDEDIVKKYGVYPGDIRTRVDTAEWLLSAMREIANLFQKSVTREISELEARVRHGAKRELLPVLRLRGVGRYRARQLFKAGYKNIEAIKVVDAAALARVPGIGPTLAASIKRAVSGEPEAQASEAAATEAAVAAPRAGQMKLQEFDQE
ncbi:MAG TPA: DEAD/DEAH box helicase [Candidatus Thermoplasmatota archaeon]|nr:DEAD/DEAH box helicase [Candidatus Thermoplasmatota archaeon]